MSDLTDQLRASTEGLGTLKQRPTLLLEGAGWRYFCLDDKTWATWAGDSYVPA